MSLNSSQRILDVEEYFKTKLKDLYSEQFELKLFGVSNVYQQSTLYRIVPIFIEIGFVGNLKHNRK